MKACNSYQLHYCRIETEYIKDFLFAVGSINCTTVELKLLLIGDIAKDEFSINCTTVELKLLLIGDIAKDEFSINCTTVELKRAKHRLALNRRRVLIALLQN
ncbi:MAG: hypothetical protein EZS28_020517 [Streblomastix strix]|uniref:Uncharacterized protein n=1 Tax=Streblomastix strix TaxID=222440 RepID=A0A5J4VMT4_9EUKA|nr:MAG: hypothetical protein EZS28_020517 [Streblomastix strix]